MSYVAFASISSITGIGSGVFVAAGFSDCPGLLDTGGCWEAAGAGVPGTAADGKDDDTAAEAPPFGCGVCLTISLHTSFFDFPL